MVKSWRKAIEFFSEWLVKGTNSRCTSMNWKLSSSKRTPIPISLWLALCGRNPVRKALTKRIDPLKKALNKG